METIHDPSSAAPAVVEPIATANGAISQPTAIEYTPAAKRGGLLRHTDFRNLWIAESISQFGTQVTMLALPLTAVLALDAAPAQMGLLTAAGTLPFLLFGLFVGVWVDRMRRRPLLIAGDLLRAAALLAVPLCWAFDALSIWVLYVVALIVGTGTVVFDVAYVSYLPSLVRRDQLVEGNSKMEASASVAQVAGPGAAGILVGLITAPAALLVDAVSYLASAVFLARIKAREERAAAHARPLRLRREIGEGLRFVVANPLLRAMLGNSATTTMFGWMFLTVYVLYMTHDLGFSPFAIGLVFGTGGIGALLGALTAERLAARFGLGRTVVFGTLAMALGGAPIPVAVLVPELAAPLLVVCEVVQWCALTVVMINQLSLRQTITPPQLLGRVTATARFLATGSIPLGGLLGGLSGELIGVRATLVVGIVGMMCSFLWVYFSPLRGVQALPESAEELSSVV